jgi:hypothetical protein
MYQQYLDEQAEGINFRSEILPSLELLAFQSIESTYKLIDPDRVGNQFEVFGYDFMISEDKKVHLIEVNSNPSLDTHNDPVMTKIIPRMIDSALRLAIDPVYPPTKQSHDGNLKR